MEIIQYKEYLDKRVDSLQRELDKINKDISLLPNPKSININDFGTRKEISIAYKAQKKRNIISLLHRPSITELQNYIYETLKEELDRQKRNIENEIYTILKILSSIKDNEIKGQIKPISAAIKELLNCCILNDTHPKYFLRLLSKLIKHKENSTEFLDFAILDNLSTYFDDNERLIQTYDVETLNFIISKLILMISEHDKDNIYDEYQKRIFEYTSKLKSDIPKDKEQQSSAQERLSKYLQNDELVQIPEDINEFISLLGICGFEIEQIEHYRILVNDAIAKEEARKENENNKVLLEKYLSENELSTMQKAKELILSSDNIELIDLLHRLYKDVISLCKYMEMSSSNIKHYIQDTLTQKINSLNLIIKNISNPNSTITKSFYFAVDDNHLPKIIHNIEFIDIILYEEIFNLLVELANNRVEGVSFRENDGIKYCHLYSDSLVLTYAVKDNEIVIIGIENISSPEKNKVDISSNTLNQVRVLYEKPKTSTFLYMQNLYENLVASQLDLRKESSKLIFHQKEE